MNDLLPSRREDVALPVSGIAVGTGVLVAYGAFALLISLVAAFANGAHSHQVLSAATWKQLGTGGGIVTGIVLFVAWGAGGLVAARTAGRDGVRHGVWVFIVGVVLITVVGAAITWLPDTTAILRNLRLLGLPVRRNEWRDIGTVAGIASVVGMAAGAGVGGWWALRAVAPAPAVTPAPVPVGAPPPLPAEPFAEEEEEEIAEPVFAGPSLFESSGFEPEPLEPSAVTAEQEDAAAEQEQVAEQAPAWLQFIEERERAIRDRDREYVVEDTSPPPEPAPWEQTEPAPTFIQDEEPMPEPAAEPVEATSWWPEQTETESQPPPAYDDAWALPDDEAAPTAAEAVEDAAFPHPPPVPVGPSATQHVEPVEPVESVESVEVVDGTAEIADVALPPLAEHAEWSGDDDGYQAPPEPIDDDVLQHAPEAPVPEIDDEEREARRRQQEEAARAYEQMREDE